MKRPWQIWLTFGAALALVLVAMAWVSWTALCLDRARVEVSRQAKVEEDVRLALWRMDSAVSRLVGREISRASFEYNAFYLPNRADYYKVHEDTSRFLVPSPLLVMEVPPFILLHFQMDSSGEITSPQMPEGKQRDMRQKDYPLGGLAPQVAEERINRLRAEVRVDSLLAALGAQEAFPPPQLDEQQVTAQEPQLVEQPVQKAQAYQQSRSSSEWRARVVTQNKNQKLDQNENYNLEKAILGRPTEDLMKPVWVNGELLLARTVGKDKSFVIQGCWLDWPAMRAQLLDSIHDLLPAAMLEPVTSWTMQRGDRLLASLPVRLIAGESPAVYRTGFTAVQMTLVVAWACMALAASAVLVLLMGAVRLSERRGAFVSAVTHELRTPLTTFRMYTEMLETGMVKGEEARKTYLRTLKTEAERLGHLVENVLAYARLESGRSPRHCESTTLGALVERATEVLRARAVHAGMELVVEVEEAAGKAEVRTDASVVEQVLFNLVDNACKYAGNASDRRIHLSAVAAGGHPCLSVCDHGPGIPREELRRLFRPFHKSARDAANSAPGVGLGLALSRRLARGMRGDLRIEPNTPEGACFVLSFPRA